MFRPLTSSFGTRSRGVQSGEIDPAILNSFGSVVEVAKPLPETEVPLVHAEDDDQLIQLDVRATRPATPPSLVSIAMRRLQSLKPANPEQQAQVMEMISLITAPLRDVDAFVATLEEEHFKAIDARWESFRQQGRELADSLPALQEEFAECLRDVNASAESKGQRIADLRARIEERRKIGDFASAKEVAAADQRVEKAREAMALATQKALDDMRAMAVVEGRIETTQEKVKIAKTELHRLQAELRGERYFDPETGLSVEPLSHRANW